ncbi:MAG: glycosyltransferase [Lachnospiraceae bacterium]|nr:glycosyltransferase [Lachnospiraceae bacterium]
MEEKKPLVSICVLAYNHKKYIRQALDSFLEQKTDFSFEIVIHDDASPDGTADIIREYEEKYPDRIKPLLQTENQYSRGIANISGAFNFPRASGKYIAFCEGDDYWLDPDKLKKQAEYMEAHPECHLYIHGARVVAEDGSFLRESRPYREDRVLRAEEVIDERELYPSASMFFRTEDVRKLPEFYWQAPVGDIPLHLYLASLGTTFYKNELMSAYRLGAVSSWVTTHGAGSREERVARSLSHNRAMRRMYRDFDAYTEGKYHAAVAYTLLRMELGYELDAEHYREALAPRYKEIRKKELSWKDRAYIRARRIVPASLYRGIRRIGTRLCRKKRSV